MQDHIMAFVADSLLAGQAQRTVQSHQLELLRLARWCVIQDLELHQVERSHLVDYARLRADRGHSSRSNMLCTLRVFFRWCVGSGILPASPAAAFKSPKKPRPLPRALTVDQVRRLLAFTSSQIDRTGQRDHVLVLTALYAGLRAAELAALRWPALDFAGGLVNIRLSKGGRGRAVPLHPELGAALIAWRTVQGLDERAPCFSLDGAALASARPGKIVSRLSRESGVPVTTHALRHTFATQMLRRSGNLYAVSKALGHAQLAQTEIYLAADVESTRPAVESLPGIGAW